MPRRLVPQGQEPDVTYALETMAQPVAAAILHCLHEYPGSTARELSDRLAVGKHQIHYHLTRLADEGLITRTGGPGPRGYTWERDETAIGRAFAMIADYLHVALQGYR